MHVLKSTWCFCRVLKNTMYFINVDEYATSRKVAVRKSGYAYPSYIGKQL